MSGQFRFHRRETRQRNGTKESYCKVPQEVQASICVVKMARSKDLNNTEKAKEAGVALVCGGAAERGVTEDTMAHTGRLGK